MHQETIAAAQGALGARGVREARRVAQADRCSVAA